MSASGSKSPRESEVESRHLVMPHETNILGTAFGGTVVSWIDMVAAMCAQRHAEGSVVTASIDGLSFEEPIQVGDHVILQARVNYAGRSSMEIGVKVVRENPNEGVHRVATRAYLTFVHIDGQGHPLPVAELLPETDHDRRRCENARLRVEARRELRSKLQSH